MLQYLMPQWQNSGHCTPQPLKGRANAMTLSYKTTQTEILQLKLPLQGLGGEKKHQLPDSIAKQA